MVIDDECAEVLTQYRKYQSHYEEGNREDKQDDHEHIRSSSLEAKSGICSFN